MKVSTLGDRWGAETSPDGFDLVYAQAADAVAPGIVEYAQQIALAGETLVAALIRARSMVTMTETQRQLLDVQLERARAGLPPLNTGVYAGTGGGGQGITLTGPMILGIAALVIFVMSRR
jgi:hypothetical protein